MPVSHILTIPHTQQYHGPILAPAGIAATIAGGIIDSSQFAGQPVRHSQLSSSANEEGSLNIVETKAGQSVQSTPAPESKPARRKSPLQHLLADGEEELSVEELLAVVVQSGNGTESNLAAARRLCGEYGARALSERLEVGEFARLARLRRPVAARIMAAIELGRRLFQPDGSDFPLINGPADVYAYVWEMKRLRQEQFRCLYLDTANRIKADRTISIGSINSSLVHPREVFHGAVQYSANAMVLIHNHPSGNLEPSRQDLALTHQLQEAGKLFSISILDHIIVGKDGYFSFKDHGRL
jgi:DNA repair protein RadC